MLLRGCDKTKGKDYSTYMDSWFSHTKIIDHLWVCKTKAVEKVMANGKQMPKQAFSKNLKKKVKQ
jgi:hypothetical protein